METERGVKLMLKKHLKELAELLDTFLYEYGSELGTWDAEADKIDCNQVFELIHELTENKEGGDNNE